VLTGSRRGGFPSRASPKTDRPGFPITGLRRDGVIAAADNGSERRVSFRDSENAATDARRGLPMRGEFMEAILARISHTTSGIDGKLQARSGGGSGPGTDKSVCATFGPARLHSPANTEGQCGTDTLVCAQRRSRASLEGFSM
jgi:hypothetical protein